MTVPQKVHPTGMHATWMRRAIHLAREHSADGVHGPFGTVIVRNGEVLGEGWNRVVASADPTAHAEMAAIRDAARRLGTHDLSGCVLYTTCEPCPMCLGAVYWARIERVYFGSDRHDAAEAGFDDADIYMELTRVHADRRIGFERLLSDEAKALFREWRNNPDRVPY